MTDLIPITLRGRQLTIEFRNHYIEEGEPDEDGEPTPDKLIFEYRLIDEEEGQLLQLTEDERAQIWNAIMDDLYLLCGA